MSAPAGVETPFCPLKVSSFSVPLFTALPPAEIATRAVEMSSGVVPNALEKRTRILLPPAETWTNCRKVTEGDASSAGMSWGSAS